MRSLRSYLISVCVCSAFLLLLPACSVFRPAPRYLLSHNQASQLLASIDSQDAMTDTLVSSGTIELREPGNKSQADFLFVGTKKPLRMKIEITHSWGRPVIHCLLDDKTFRLVDYIKKTVYIGSLNSARKILFLPGIATPTQVWSIFRGYPEICDYNSFAMPVPAAISMRDEMGTEVQRIGFDLQNFAPKTVSYPLLKLDVFYSNFKRLEGYIYAGKVEVAKSSDDQKIVLLIKKILFNKQIPGQIFNLPIPPGYKTISLK